MRRVDSSRVRVIRVFRAAVVALMGGALLVPGVAASCGDGASDKPVYLTFDTGHMGVAPLVADVLWRQHVKVTFFLADERTRTDGTSLDDVWAPWWKARAAEGHAFGSHTFEHAVWLADEAGGFRMKPTAGPNAGHIEHWSAARYCTDLQRAADRFKAMTGMPMGAIFRAPAGKVSPALIEAASQCGWTHVPWSPAGFLGDELASERFPNAALLEKALRDIRSGDILLAHLGIWSRHDAWAPADLEPLIKGLKAKGFCFATLKENPRYRDAAGLARP